MNRIIIAAAIAAAITGTAHADLQLKVKTTKHSQVWVNGRYRGSGNTKIRNLRPGKHSVKVIHTSTGRTKRFNVRSNRRKHEKQTLNVSFASPKYNHRYSRRDRYNNARWARRNRRSYDHRYTYNYDRQHRYEEPRVIYLPSPAPAPIPCPTTVSLPPETTYPAQISYPVQIAQPTVVHKPSNAKVRRRNKILAVAAANELFTGRTRERRDIRKGAAVATVLNEIFSR